MKKLKSAFVILTVMFLSGCQTAAQREAARIVSAMQAADRQFGDCVNAVVTKPVYEPIVRRIATSPLPGARPALERIGDTEFASTEEARLLVPYFDEVSACADRYAAAYDTFHPSQAALIRGYVVDAARRTLSLMRREINWGTANQHADAALLVLRTAAQENDRRLVARLNAEHTAEVANQRVALEALSLAGAAMQQAAIRQEMLNAMRQPLPPARRTTTSCVRTGNVVSCDSF